MPLQEFMQGISGTFIESGNVEYNYVTLDFKAENISCVFCKSPIKHAIVSPTGAILHMKVCVHY